MSEEKPAVKVDVLPISIDSKEAFKLVDKILHKPFKGFLEQTGSMFAEMVYHFRTTNRIKTFLKVQKMLSSKNLPREVIPNGWIVPAIEAIGDVEDEDLQTLWANLLYNATLSTDVQQPQYIHTLKLMSSEDAKRLVAVASRGRAYFEGISKEVDFEIDKPLGRLVSLGLVQGPSVNAYSTDDTTEPPTVLTGPGFLTPYGKQLLDAVSCSFDLKE